MTTDQAERIRGHIASLMVAIRPDWDVAGCVAALRRLPDLPTGALTIAAIRYADDEKNTTPAMLSDLGNRAWASDWHLPCKRHPKNTSWRVNGECGSCYADRNSAEYEPRQPRDPSAEPHPLEAALCPSRRSVMTSPATRMTNRGPRDSAEMPSIAENEMEQSPALSKGLIFGECGTPECHNTAHWIPVSDIPVAPQPFVYRCPECCDRIDRERWPA